VTVLGNCLRPEKGVVTVHRMGVVLWSVWEGPGIEN